MAVTAAALAVSLTARTENFLKGMKKSRKSVKSFSSSVKSASIGALKFGAGLATVGVGGLALLTRSSLKSIDTTAKLAARIGTTTEAITSLQHAAEITGAGAGTMAKSLDFMGKSLGEVKLGIGEAKVALEQMDINLDNLLKQSPDQQFETIAEAVSGLATQQEKAAVAAKIFGRGGIALVNTLSLGKSGLQQMRQEAALLGITFSSLDASKVESSNDALTRIKSVFTGLGNTIAIKVSPFIDAFSTAMTNIITNAGGMGPIVSKAFAGIATSVGWVLDQIQNAQIMTAAFKLGILELANAGIRAFVSLADTVAEFASLLPGIDVQVSDSVRAFADGFQQEVDAQRRVVGDLANAPSFSSRLNAKINEIQSAATDKALLATQGEFVGPPLPGSGGGGGITSVQADQMIAELRQTRIGLVG